MEQVFRCSVCKKEFSGYDAEKDCLNDEISCLGLKSKLDDIVKKCIEILTSEYSVKIIEEKHDVNADSANFGMDYEIYKFFNGKAEYKGKVFNFYINNDSVGDGRYEYTLDTVDSLVDNFIYKYLRKKEIESNEIIGIVELYEQDNIDEEDIHHYVRYWNIGDQNIDDLMYILEGKKIKIEVLE